MWVAAAVVALASAGPSAPRADALDTSADTTTGMQVGLSQTGWFGFAVMVKGSRPVHLTAARIVGVPTGMRVLGIYAMPDTYGMIGADRDLRERNSFLGLQPVTSVVLDPDADADGWYLLAEVRPTRLGSFTSEGIEIDYVAGGRKGTARLAQRVWFEVTRERWGDER
jgi:hypothetical protein